MSDKDQTTALDDASFARVTARSLIDLGAACQKARSFTIVSQDTEARSVYDVMAERLLAALTKHFRGGATNAE